MGIQRGCHGGHDLLGNRTAEPRSGDARGTIPARHRPRKQAPRARCLRSEEHTSELQSLMRISYAVFCLKKKKTKNTKNIHTYKNQNKQRTKRNEYTTHGTSMHNKNNTKKH